MPTGEELLALAKTKIGQKYVLGAMAPKDDKNYKGPWDCAEFTSWLVFQIANKLYGCYSNVGNPAKADAYTGYWKRDATQLGKIITLAEAAKTPGAAVLRAAVDGQMGHIVISDGKGGTVEAHSTKMGVIASTLSGRRWDYGILVSGITYTKAGNVVVTEPSATIYRLTDPMMVHSKVGEIQKALKKAGFDPQGTDNIFGRETAKAVMAFQQSKSLVADGEVGEITAGALGVKLDAAAGLKAAVQPNVAMATANDTDVTLHVEIGNGISNLKITPSIDGINKPAITVNSSGDTQLAGIGPGDSIRFNLITAAASGVEITVKSPRTIDNGVDTKNTFTMFATDNRTIIFTN